MDTNHSMTEGEQPVTGSPEASTTRRTRRPRRKLRRKGLAEEACLRRGVRDHTGSSLDYHLTFAFSSGDRGL